MPRRWRPSFCGCAGLPTSTAGVPAEGKSADPPLFPVPATTAGSDLAAPAPSVAGARANGVIVDDAWSLTMKALPPGGASTTATFQTMTAAPHTMATTSSQAIDTLFCKSALTVFRPSLAGSGPIVGCRLSQLRFTFYVYVLRFVVSRRSSIVFFVPYLDVSMTSDCGLRSNTRSPAF